ncbi:MULTISPECIES: hypothetical protein [Acidobacteriaceae]|uniref:hypothetical protein n=1 Tax=Acidobacteriaceae TaxID=204434 RepID=UPI00131C8BF6|nr:MULTISPECIES: hypothetical protein [Acidobacteriaceae]MDW5266346.1 hypothetical protein [Edaphobacter sp.]
MAGLSVGILTIAVASFFFYQHYASQFPADTQNLLSALTSAMVVGIGVGAVAAVATAGGYLMFGMVGHRPEPDETKKAVDS